jgi:hypothetical protein
MQLSGVTVRIKARVVLRVVELVYFHRNAEHCEITNYSDKTAQHCASKMDQHLVANLSRLLPSLYSLRE